MEVKKYLKMDSQIMAVGRYISWNAECDTRHLYPENPPGLSIFKVIEIELFNIKRGFDGY